jgi:tetratricopeptide (TPR) repeat protein
VAYVSPHNEMADKALRSGRTSEYFERHDEAISHYETILAHDPDHYAANFLLGRIYQNKKNDPATARMYLERAKASNPFAPLTRQLLASNRWFSAEGDLSLDELGALIEEAQEALSLAESTLDFYSDQLLRHTLAHFYANRYELTNNDVDLETSVTLCAILEKQIAREKRLQSAAFFDTYAYVLSHKHDGESLEKALELVDEADGLEPRNVYIATTRLRILKRLKAVKRT